MLSRYETKWPRVHMALIAGNNQIHTLNNTLRQVYGSARAFGAASKFKKPTGAQIAATTVPKEKLGGKRPKQRLTTVQYPTLQTSHPSGFKRRYRLSVRYPPQSRDAPVLVIS